MKKEMTRKKALLIIKLSIVLAIALLVVLFSIIIAQTVEINNLQNEIDTTNQTYQSQVENHDEK